MSTSYISEIIKRTVWERANGRCEYCLMPESILSGGLQYDHIISEKQGGETIESNLAMACPFCNRYKGPLISSYVGNPKRVVRLYHPRLDNWEDHFELLQSGIISPITDIATGTAFVLKMNSVHLVKQRSELIEVGMM